MRFAALACFVALAFAGANAEEAGLAQGRIVDLWFENAIAEFIAYIQGLGLDPMEFENQSHDYNIWDGLIQMRGVSKDINGYGLSDIVIKSVSYNIVWGRLDYEITLPRIFASIGKYQFWASIAGNVNNFEISGRASINDLTISGNAVLYINVGIVRILNIHTEISVGEMKSDLNVITNRGDISSRVNYVFSERIPRTLVENKDEVTTVANQIIRAIAERRFPN